MSEADIVIEREIDESVTRLTVEDVRQAPYVDPFSDVLDELAAMHDRKGQDYGKTNDPYANVRASEDFGISGWVGAIVRGNDKMKRLQKAAQGRELANESIEDSLIDLAVYAIIGLILFREEQE